MKLFIAVVVTLLLVLTVEGRRRFRPQQQNLSKCRSVMTRQGRGMRGCSPQMVKNITGDLDQIHASDRRVYTRVLERWVADRARAMDPTIPFDTLVTSGSCLRMMCFKTEVNTYVKKHNYQVPHFCRRKTGRQYLVRSLTLRRTRQWTVNDMETVFCAKAYDPDFSFH